MYLVLLIALTFHHNYCDDDPVDISVDLEKLLLTDDDKLKVKEDAVILVSRYEKDVNIYNVHCT